jgi:monoterpene epsilon-lactone hydrolase
MASLSNRVLSAVLTVTRAKKQLDSVEKVQRLVAELAVHPAPFAPPVHLEGMVDFSCEDRRGWTCYRVRANGPRPPMGRVFYLHGGGFIGEIVAQHWSLIAGLAAGAPAEVIVPIYPLAPHSTARHTVATATDLVAELLALGTDDVTLMGDSAGGTIALVVAQQLHRRGLAQPRRIVLISPVLDVTKRNPAIAAVARHDPMLTVTGTAESGRLYAGDLDPSDPLVSPINGDLHGLAPVTLFSGTHDINNPDARELVRRATAAGLPLDYHEVRGGLHVYPLLRTREGAAARRVITDLARARGLAPPEPGRP